MPVAPGSSIIWVRIERPTFDLVGVLLSSLGITGICVGVALALGAAWGGYLILRERRRPHVPLTVDLDLQLSPAHRG
jgi:hypothetical protein